MLCQQKHIRDPRVSNTHEHHKAQAWRREYYYNELLNLAAEVMNLRDSPAERDEPRLGKRAVLCPEPGDSVQLRPSGGHIEELTLSFVALLADELHHC